ncbi:MAG TPA: hypothetical protein VMZ53_18550 [Kofleriaceae bacterium]|nr:hypothetical protein [Kofleriaceae bacterium]
MRLALLAILCLTTTAFAETPQERAKAFVTTQLNAIVKNDADAFKATFSADAVLLASGAYEPIATRENLEFQQMLMSGSPHDVFKKAKLDKIVAGGDANVIWLTAELATTYDAYDEETPPKKNQTARTRLTELLVADGTTWKAVAASLAQPRSSSGTPEDPSHTMVESATKPGPLAPLVANPTELIKKLSADKNVFVLGTDKNERAVGQTAAKKLLTGWSKLKLTIDEKSVREVATKTYAFAQVSVTYTTPKKVSGKAVTLYHPMTAIIMAVPSGSDWSVVGVNYIADR